MIVENDQRSDASFSYDDVDEVTDARPLTSEAAAAPGNRYNSEDNFEQSAGKFGTSD